MTIRIASTAAAALICTLGSAAAQAQTASDWERPYGYGQGQEQRAWSGVSMSAGEASSRDQNGNRVVIDGLIQTGVGVSSQLSGYTGGVGASAAAIGNQLNVNVQGNYNSVVINSTQINNGDVNAYANANGNVSEANDED